MYYIGPGNHNLLKKECIDAMESFQKGTPESFLKTPESFSETPESFRRIHIHFEVILVMAITRAEKVCCGKFANCFLVFCGLVGRACNRERLGEGDDCTSWQEHLKTSSSQEYLSS